MTPSADVGAPDELSLFMDENHGMGLPNKLYRYTIRMDGVAEKLSGQLVRMEVRMLDGDLFAMQFL